MKKIYAVCLNCKGRGVISVPWNDNTLAISNPNFSRGVETCKACNGKGHSDKVLFFVEDGSLHIVSNPKILIT